MNSPFSLRVLLLLLIILGALSLLIQVGILTYAFQKLGLSAEAAITILLAALVGSAINIPLFRIKSSPPPDATDNWPPYQLLRPYIKPFQGWTIVAVNVGGCVIPVLLVMYLYATLPLEPFRVLVAITVVTLVSYSFSRPIPGLGIAMPILLAPVAAAPGILTLP